MHRASSVGRGRSRSRVSFQELSDSGGSDYNDEDAAWEAGAAAAASSSAGPAARSASAAEDDGLVIVAGGSGSKKRIGGRPKGSLSRKVPRLSGSVASLASSSASPLSHSLAARYAEDGSLPNGGSSLLRRETAEHLGYFEQISMPAKKSSSTLAGIPKMDFEVSRQPHKSLIGPLVLPMLIRVLCT
jgi:hypothetical protein